MPIAETALGRLMVYLGADPSALQQGLRSASESLKRFDSTTKRFSTSVTRYITNQLSNLQAQLQQIFHRQLGFLLLR